jgi:hypothetical protein
VALPGYQAPKLRWSARPMWRPRPGVTPAGCKTYGRVLCRLCKFHRQLVVEFLVDDNNMDREIHECYLRFDTQRNSRLRGFAFLFHGVDARGS